MQGKISASVMCADFLELGKSLKEMEEAGIEYLHFDIMDGSFVPNFTMGPCILEQVRGKSSIPFDIHLMIERPEDKLDVFGIQAGDWVSVHYESTYHVQRLLFRLREMGAHPGIAINPGTPVEMVREVLDDVDYVLVMTVNPGFAGQKLVPRCLEKIRELRAMLKQEKNEHILIEVDGNVSFELVGEMRRAGADIFVAGTSGLFRKEMGIVEAAKCLRDSMERGEKL